MRSIKFPILAFTILTTLITTSIPLTSAAYGKGGPKQTVIDNPHNITPPHEDPTRWLNTMKQTRVAQLFSTREGLRGHVEQIQNEINRVTNNLNGKQGSEVSEYTTALGELRKALIASAKGAEFDFDRFEIRFSPLVSPLYLERQNKGLKVNGTLVH